MAEEHNGSAEAEVKQLQQLSERYSEVFQRGAAAGATVETSLMRMMAAMGELSALAYASASGISPFEREEVSRLVGKLSLSVAAIAEAFDLDVARATLHFLEEELKTASPPRRPAAAPAAVAAVAAAPSPSPRHGSAMNASPPDSAPVVLSPASHERFFRFVDQLATAPRESFQEANLKWVAPAPSGAIEELIPNGRAITVSYDDFPRYRARLAQYRDERTRQPQTSPSPAATAPMSSAEAHAARGGGAVAATVPAVVAQAPGYDAARESDLYSPSHFSGGLFSPMARATEATVVNVYPPAAVTASEQMGHTEALEGRRRQQALQQIGRPYEVSDFNQKVSLLRSGIVQGPEVAKLGLTFSIPDGPRVVELINDGMQVNVTAANARAFLDLVDNFSSAQMPSPARVHRTNSVRKIDVQPIIPDVPPTFSPSHFSHDLFAPFANPTSAVYVDYDKSERILPPFLKEHVQTAPKDTRSLYLNAARCTDCTTLERILREVRLSPAAVTKYGVTFCVPSSLEPYSTPEERHTGLHALFPSSALQPVTPEQQPQFLSLVRQYFPHVV